MSSTAKRRLHIIITVMIMAFIFIQSSLTAELSSQESEFLTPIIAETFKVDTDSASTAVRKCAHFLEYLILSIFMALSVRDFIEKNENMVRKGKPVWFLISWGACAVYSISDEIHQAFVPGRSCEIRDMLIDCCGAAVGAGIIVLVKNIRSRA